MDTTCCKTQGIWTYCKIHGERKCHRGGRNSKMLVVEIARCLLSKQAKSAGPPRTTLPCFFVAVLMMVDNWFFWGSPIINPKPLYFGWTRGKQDCSSWFFLAKDCHCWAENTWDFVSLLKTFLWKLRITHQSAESSTWYTVCWGATGETGGPTATSKFCFVDR